MTTPLRLGIAGLGTVGTGLVNIISTHAELLATRAGRQIEISAVSARDRLRTRNVDLSAYAWEDDAVALARRPDVDVFVELIGGDAGIAKAATEAALAHGKHVVTANKAMLAHHGQALALAAEEAGLALKYEAAVAGGIPAIKSLLEGLAGNQITRVMGVMNGTCNYILTRMEEAGLDYQTLFSEAEALGYLEADPELDVGGIDAAHKLTLLSSIAFGGQVDFAGVEMEGIQSITLEDIHSAGDLGYRIKLLGVAQLTEDGLEQRMSPCLVPMVSHLGQLKGGTNMCVFEGDSIGQIILGGPGAGSRETASAVISDVMDIARGAIRPVFGQPASSLARHPRAISDHRTQYYINLTLKDEAGVLAKVAQKFADHGISIDRMRQRDHKGDGAPVIIVSHKTRYADIKAALDEVNALNVCLSAPVFMRIEQA